MNILIRNATILTMDSEELVKGNIGIEKDRIAFIGNKPETFEADYEIEAEEHLAMPGLVNAHTHSAMSLLRNYADDIPFWEWLTEKVWPIEEKMNDKDVYWGTMISIAEMFRSGTTAYADMYFHSEETAKASCEAGIRCSVAKGLIGSSEEDEKLFADTRGIHRDWNGAGDGIITVMAGPHAPYTCDPGFLHKVMDLCAELRMPLHIHLSESEKEVEESIKKFGKSPIAHVHALGLFQHHTLAAHCVHLVPGDISLLKEGGVHVAHNPLSNLKLGNGTAPVTEMHQAGINLSIGTDSSCSNNNLNLFEEMKMASLLAKGRTADSTVLSAFETLKMATINGYKALNLDESLGKLKAGSKADLILIDMNQPHWYPHQNLKSSLVYSSQGSDVSTVIVNGKIVMEKRELKTIDLQRVKYESDKIVDRIY